MNQPLRLARLTAPLALALTLGCTGRVDDAGAGDPATPPDPPPPATDPVATELLSLHDIARASATPTPSPALPAHTWSDAAASAAQAWANGCSWKHDPALGTLGMGQNIYAVGSTSPSVSATPAQVVGSWVGEAANYHHDTNTCDAGKVCGHYTAVVWRTTTGVGCGHHVCTTASPFGTKYAYWDYWVCNYVPPGNWVGQKPY